MSIPGSTDGRTYWPRGRALGGSTVINFMMAIRGNRLDYDKWAEMGNTGWSYEEVLPYFLKSEDVHMKLYEKQYHAKGGFLPNSDARYNTKAAQAFVNAAQEVGYPYVDYNGKTQFGVRLFILLY